MLAKEIKPGVVVVYGGNPIMVASVFVQTPSARGAATLYKFRGRNLVTRQKADFTLKGADALPVADFEKRPVKLMYADPTHMHLLDQTDFNAYAIALEDVEEERPYVTESLDGMFALVYNGECVGIQLPAAVELTVTECDPGVKGNSATGRTKPATVETGLIVQVPEYLSSGERIKVDTRSGEYLSRA
ncbi:MAG: translation elongation factor EF-P [Planctomycetes bacterium]|nr:translation elongation factor EF-P [Planctomycetota bacterium]